MILSLTLIMLLGNYSYGEDIDLSGKSYILMDEVSGRILYGKNINEKMAMASTTKIMTALVALEQGNLNDKVHIGVESTNIEGSSLYLKPDEIIPLQDLLYGLMLRSGNDAAIAIANHISGSEEAFVNLMNNKAKLIGANNSNFNNPHGLTAKDHYSTAYDLAIITRESFKIKGFKEIVSAKNYTASRDENNYFVNKNKTLWEYKDGDGVKIGYTMNAGRCLVSSATRNGMRLIAVSLKAPNWFNDNYKLFDYGFENFKPHIIYDNAHFITNINIPNGKNEVLALVTENSFTYPLKDDEINNLKISINTDKETNAPILKNQVLGRLEVYLDGVLIKEENLIAKTNVVKKTLWQNIMNKIKK